MTHSPERRRGRPDESLREERRNDQQAWADRQRKVGGVLLVDCVPDEQETYADALRQAGFDPVVVCEAADAFDAAVSTPPSIVIVDLSIGDAALGLISALRGDARTRSCPIVAVSARAFPEQRAAAQRAGCDVFLSKPCPSGTLINEVRNVLAGEASVTRAE